MNIRKILGLPESRSSRGKEPQPETTYGQAATSVWTAAEAEAKDEAVSQAHPAWTPVRTTRAGRVWPMVLRGLVALLCLIVAVAGVRAIFFPVRTQQATQQGPSAEAFPQVAAAGVATRFVGSFYTWEQGQGPARARALTLDAAGGVSEQGAYGWAGTGKQSATNASVVAISPSSAEEGRVTVRFTLTAYTGQVGAWKATKATTRAADVNVRVIDGRVAVVGMPALVAVPEAGEAPNGPDELVGDEQVTASTKEYATSFFRAYGSDPNIDALVAPGSRIQGLGGYELVSVSTWLVYTGDGDERPATAVVQWRDPTNKTVLEQSYSVTLQRVTGGNTERWQIARLTGK